MAEDELMEERIRAAFSLVKDDIAYLKEEVLAQKEQISALNGRINKIVSEKMEKKDNLSLFDSSIGNEGVVNNQQQSTTINNNDQRSTITNRPSLPQKEGENRLEEALKNVDIALAQKIQGLTDREFSLFLAILEFGEQGQESTYTDLADRLNLSESAVRGVVNRLVSKGLPLTKHRFLHKKAVIQVNPSFRELHALQRIVAFRHGQQSQTSLTQF